MFTFHLARKLVPATAESPKGPKSVYMWVCVCVCVHLVEEGLKVWSHCQF